MKTRLMVLLFSYCQSICSLVHTHALYEILQCLMLSHFTHHPHPQAVDIHKEKVARREIGALASSKNITRAQKVVVPAQKERPQKFFRQRLDFTCLDGIGHGTKVADSTTRIDERYSGKEVSELICQVL